MNKHDVKTASLNLSAILADHIVHHDDRREVDERVNEASRRLVEAYCQAYGTCWLGRINPDSGEMILYEYRPGDTLYTFGADFVIPTYDQVLVNMISGRLSAEYKGTSDDYKRVSAIHERVYRLDGDTLAWT